MGILIRWGLNALALFVTVLLAQAFKIDLKLTSPLYALVAVLILGLVNAVIRPIAKLLTMPINCLTLGIFGFVINALMFWLVGSFKETGLHVGGFLPALFGSIVFSILSALANKYVRSRQERENE